MIPVPVRRMCVSVAVLFLVLPVLVVAAAGVSAAARTPALVLVLDASESMNDDAPSGRPKLVEAKAALRIVAAELPPGAPVGLRVYGPREAPEVAGRSTFCRGTRAVVPVRPLDAAGFTAAAARVTASGATPTGYALRQAAADRPGAAIVLVSDGRDTCGPADPCDVARTIADRDVPSRIHTIGLALGAEQQAREQLRCIADATGGTYTEVTGARALAGVVRKIASVSGLAPAGRPVAGTADPVTAPVVVPGTRPYADTLPTGEPRYYAVRVGPGQRVGIRGTVTGTAPPCPAVVDLDLLSPGLAEAATVRRPLTGGRAPTTVEARATASAVPTSAEPDTRPPGTWWARVTVEQSGCADPPQRYALRLGVSLNGPSAPPSGTSSPSPSPPGERARSAEPRTRVPGALLVAAQLAVGLTVLVVVLLRLVRPHPPAGRPVRRRGADTAPPADLAPDTGPPAPAPPDDGLYHRPRR